MSRIAALIKKIKTRSGSPARSAGLKPKAKVPRALEAGEVIRARYPLNLPDGRRVSRGAEGIVVTQSSPTPGRQGVRKDFVRYVIRWPHLGQQGWYDRDALVPIGEELFGESGRLTTSADRFAAKVRGVHKREVSSSCMATVDEAKAELDAAQKALTKVEAECKHRKTKACGESRATSKAKLKAARKRVVDAKASCARAKDALRTDAQRKGGLLASAKRDEFLHESIGEVEDAYPGLVPAFLRDFRAGLIKPKPGDVFKAKYKHLQGKVAPTWKMVQTRPGEAFLERVQDGVYDEELAALQDREEQRGADEMAAYYARPPEEPDPADDVERAALQTSLGEDERRRLATEEKTKLADQIRGLRGSKKTVRQGARAELATVRGGCAVRRLSVREQILELAAKFRATKQRMREEARATCDAEKAAVTGRAAEGLARLDGEERAAREAPLVFQANPRVRRSKRGAGKGKPAKARRKRASIADEVPF